MSLELHPLCTLFPRLEGAEFEALKADIAANGQLQPVVLHDGMILDGGNRYRACVELGIEPVIADMDLGDYDLLSYVLSVNLHRRHLTPGQHAAIVAAATNWLEAQVQGSNQYEVKVAGATLHYPDGRGLNSPATLTDRSTSTVADRAAKSGASIRTQKMADKVAKADPELVKRVAHGEISLPQALKQVEGKDRDPSEAGTENDFPRVEHGQESSQTVDSTDDAEFHAHVDDLYAQIDRLQRSNDALTSTDQGAEMMKQMQLLLNAESALSVERERGAVREKQLNWFGRQYAELRKILGVKNDRDVLSAVRKLTEKQL
ncbi:ParB/RepB/Spo0J family partition protein [Paraburkholderia strydomiana]|uniref:ParB/RepB/Spo0J family partition protein n=1 Tax=Paraburkholderia strydomiana TaxID=1245417 RepID=UPI0028548CBF|nr:ParB N-terminal domain-containing protein [Paraburkholderia strydomiana]MDR7006071.1 ParB-like chromosome segregation protein Spo0J [Paraburkholderia strydomiana]